MPAALKVVIAVNVVLVIALVLVGLVGAGGFVPAVFPSDEGRELQLIPIRQEAAEGSGAVVPPLQRAEIPPEYRTPDPTPSPWVATPVGSVRFVRSE